MRTMNAVEFCRPVWPISLPVWLRSDTCNLCWEKDHLHFSRFGGRTNPFWSNISNTWIVLFAEVLYLFRNCQKICCKMSASSYKCDCCDFSTAYKQHMRKHKETKHEGVRYSCSRCEYQATLKQNLVRHCKTKHGSANFKYMCDFCDHQATFRYEIALHIKSDHYGVEYECDICEYKAKEKKTLAQHKETRHQERIYECRQCEFKSKTRQTLTNHKWTKHYGIMYMCDQCDHEAGHPKSLLYHKQRKHQHLRYCCDKCEYEAGDKKSLVQHNRSKHLGVRYNCDQCQFKTLVSKKVQEHKKLNHEKKPTLKTDPPCQWLMFYKFVRLNFSSTNNKQVLSGFNNSCCNFCVVVVCKCSTGLYFCQLSASFFCFQSSTSKNVCHNKVAQLLQKVFINQVCKIYLIRCLIMRCTKDFCITQIL